LVLRRIAEIPEFYFNIVEKPNRKQSNAKKSSLKNLDRAWNVIPRKEGPRRFQQKKLQILDSIQLEGEPKGLHADIGSLQDLIKRAQNLK
jgi:hypothetical protein